MIFRSEHYLPSIFDQFKNVLLHNPRREDNMMEKIYDDFKGNRGIIDKDRYSEMDIVCMINDLIQKLTKEERLALFIHYLSTESEFGSNNCPFNLHTRERALKKLCVGMQKKGFRVTAPKCHPYKGSMKHSPYYLK